MKDFAVKSIFLILISFCGVNASPITVIGCGYVGLTLAGILVEAGHYVTCVDISEQKIASLQTHRLPFYEPHLSELLFNDKLIVFTHDVQQGREADFFFICVPTPPGPDGLPNLSELYTVFKQIVACVSKKTICIKSTVSPGTCSELKKISGNNTVIYSPEFMREGTALQDIHHNPLVFGGDDLSVLNQIAQLYPTTGDIIITNFETAELIKYAWNTFSALRIAYMNELAVLCKNFNADIATVIRGIAQSEHLLPTTEIKPGPGWGGSCLPKDTAAFARVFEGAGFVTSLAHHVIQSNKYHTSRLLQDLDKLVKENQCASVALLGLSFKANTNDLRNSIALEIITALLNQGIMVRLYDPQSLCEAQRLFGRAVFYYDSPYEAIQSVDCIMILTEWEEIAQLRLDEVAKLCNKKIIFDTRNLFDCARLKQYGFTYINMGRT